MSDLYSNYIHDSSFLEHGRFSGHNEHARSGSRKKSTAKSKKRDTNPITGEAKPINANKSPSDSRTIGFRKEREMQRDLSSRQQAKDRRYKKEVRESRSARDAAKMAQVKRNTDPSDIKKPVPRKAPVQDAKVTSRKGTYLYDQTQRKESEHAYISSLVKKAAQTGGRIEMQYNGTTYYMTPYDVENIIEWWMNGSTMDGNTFPQDPNFTNAVLNSPIDSWRIVEGQSRPLNRH